MVRILHAVTRREDIVARYGGEEFAVIFPDANIDEAYGIAESVRLSFKDYRFPNEASQPGGNLTVSGGVVMYTDDLQDGSEMIVRADEALYQAKREGRNRIISYKGIA
jgi:diguanylate cyclase (GGDEF)-like protein